MLNEAYHTLAYYLQWMSEKAAERITLLLRQPFIKFYNQLKTQTPAKPDRLIKDKGAELSSTSLKIFAQPKTSKNKKTQSTQKNV